MKEKVRVASGQGFWGDLLTAPVDQVRNGPIDYLMLDYLAEVTMSIMQKQRARDPQAGYAKDFVALMREILPDCVERDIKVLSNAGGVNVQGCAEAIKQTAVDLGLNGKVKIGVVTGDDILGRLDEFAEKASKLPTWKRANHFPKSATRSRQPMFILALGRWSKLSTKARRS
jgi:hypothetical protein